MSSLVCPCCKASNTSAICRRCKADLSLMQTVAQTHAAHLGAAKYAIATRQLALAQEQLRHAQALQPSDEAKKLLAAVAVLQAHGPTAFQDVVHSLNPAPPSSTHHG